MGMERVYLRDTAEIQLPNAKSYNWETFGCKLLELSVGGGSFIFAQKFMCSPPQHAEAFKSSSKRTSLHHNFI